MPWSIYSLYRAFQPRLRQRRQRLFLDLFAPDAATRILDVGGHVYDWDGVVPIASPVTFVNVTYPPLDRPLPPRFTCLLGDGRRLPFADGSFDIVYSNSVIEHLGHWADQVQFARELRRVGRQLFVQTPNRWFFVEPHFLAPGVHLLPRRAARRLLPWCSVRGWWRRGDNVSLPALAEELRLLTRREMQALFPDCAIYRERWLGMTKSLIAVRRDPAQHEGGTQPGLRPG